MSNKYSPMPPPNEESKYAYTELQDLARAISEPQPELQLQVLYRAPVRPREGMTVVADGSSWNPGSGAGPYTYIGGTWTPLFTGGAGGGQSSIQFKDEGSNLGSVGTVTSVDFVGTGVTATRVSNALTVTVAGGSVSDGDKGDITVSGGGTVWTLDLALNQIAAPTGSVSFNDQQATSFRIENRTSDPVSPTTGQIWLRTDL